MDTTGYWASGHQREPLVINSPHCLRPRGGGAPRWRSCVSGAPTVERGPPSPPPRSVRRRAGGYWKQISRLEDLRLNFLSCGFIFLTVSMTFT